MRKLFEKMRSRCEDFLAQRDDLAMVVRARETEYTALVSTLDGIDKSDSLDSFWLFADPFESKISYVNTISKNFQAQYEALNAIEIDDGEPPLPPLPLELFDSQRSPVQRLKELMICARGLIPDLEEAHLVWGFLPGSIGDPVEYAALMVELLRFEMPFPWCHHMRVLVRETWAQPVLHQYGKSKMPRVQWYSPDMSTPAIEEALAEEAADESLPLRQRMQSLFVLAGMDIAQRRLDSANRKYQLLAKYYNAIGDKPLCSLSMNGLGEIAERKGNPTLARDYYERALTPAAESESLPALTNATLNLANLHLSQKRWNTAYEHYQAVVELAKAYFNPQLMVRCLEQMGVCRYELKDPKGAIANWNIGKDLAKSAGANGELLGCLKRLQRLYSELRMNTQKENTTREIAELEKQGVKAYPA
jgi:tetratricopeptide (TPR) repeat protein